MPKERLLIILLVLSLTEWSYSSGDTSRGEPSRQRTCGKVLTAHLGLPPDIGFFRRLFFLTRKPLPEMDGLQQKRMIFGNKLINEAQNVFEMGEWTKEVVIIVHQWGRLQEVAAQKLRTDPRLINAPRLVLVSDLFPITSQDLYNETSFLYYSEGGEFNLSLNTGEIHMMGGFWEHCVQTATLYALDQVLKSSITDLDIIYHLQAVYEANKNFAPQMTLNTFVKTVIDRAQWQAQIVPQPDHLQDNNQITINGPYHRQRIRFRVEE